jgi:hypothetical protein
MPVHSKFAQFRLTVRKLPLEKIAGMAERIRVSALNVLSLHHSKAER